MASTSENTSPAAFGDLPLPLADIEDLALLNHNHLNQQLADSFLKESSTGTGGVHNNNDHENNDHVMSPHEDDDSTCANSDDNNINNNAVSALSPAHHQAPATSLVPGTQTVFVRTFGCAHNVSDGEIMAGLLKEYGYNVTDAKPESADAWLINTCTVKGPSQASAGTWNTKAKHLNKPVVFAGCIPQGDPNAGELKGASLLGVAQLTRVVEVVEETMKGNTVRWLGRRVKDNKGEGKRGDLPPLKDMPRVRRNERVEILPLSTGCLGNCTYCKTKHARGALGSYPVETLTARTKAALEEGGVREVWLSSEDTGAYGRDIDATLAKLASEHLLPHFPKHGASMMRIGMTNPPFMLDSLREIADVLRHPACFKFLHIPVQSGSNDVLLRMNREYTVEEFERVVDTLQSYVPELEVSTDIIVGFPGETEEDFEATMRLVEKYRFAKCHISQFYPRPGTPAASMKNAVPGNVKKARTRRLTALVESFDPYTHLVGSKDVCIWITEKAADGSHLVGHTENYTQVLVTDDNGSGGSLLGCVARVDIVKSSRWSVHGVLRKVTHDAMGVPLLDNCQPVAAPAPAPAAHPDDDASANVLSSTATNNVSTPVPTPAPAADGNVVASSTIQKIDRADAVLVLAALVLGIAAAVAWYYDL